MLSTADQLKLQLEEILQRELSKDEFEECLHNLALLGEALIEYYKMKASSE